MGVIVRYKGTPISNLTTTSTVRLDTGGKVVEADHFVEYTAPTIPNLGVMSNFGTAAFKNCAGTDFKNITINSDVTSIGSQCFYGCTNLISVTGFGSVTSIGSEAFSGCTALTTLPSTGTLTSIGESAFENCSSLTEFILPTNLTTLGNKVFRGCSALTKIELSGTLNNFAPGSNSNSLIHNLTALTTVKLPGGSYGGYVITNCSKIRSITMGGPNNPVSSIANTAFDYCTGPITFTVYTVGAQELSHNSSTNYWGSNTTGTSCTFKDSEGIEPDRVISF